MLNPALIEMAAHDRIAELRAGAVRRSRCAGPWVRAETGARHAVSRSILRLHLANPQQAIGWFLVSVGLRLALPRTRTGSAR